MQFAAYEDTQYLCALCDCAAGPWVSVDDQADFFGHESSASIQHPFCCLSPGLAAQ
jgi:hypothetical protein